MLGAAREKHIRLIVTKGRHVPPDGKYHVLCCVSKVVAEPVVDLPCPAFFHPRDDGLVSKAPGVNEPESVTHEAICHPKVKVAAVRGCELAYREREKGFYGERIVVAACADARALIRVRPGRVNKDCFKEDCSKLPYPA